MFRYERVNSKRKFSIVAEIVFLLKKIYKRDAPLRAMFNVKTLAVLFSPYPREMKTITAKFKSAAILTLTYFYGNCVTYSHARAPKSHARGLSMRTYLTAVLPLAMSNTGSPQFTDFPSLCACSESSLTNLIGSGLNLLCFQSHSKTECRWTGVTAFCVPPCYLFPRTLGTSAVCSPIPSL